VNADVRLQPIIGATRYLLLDFDGPICSIFAGLPAPLVAQRIREKVVARGGHISKAMEGTDDPLELLRLTARDHDPRLTEAIAADLRDAEIEAIHSARPTPNADELLYAADRGSVPVAIVSNNSAEAVSAYLLQRRLSDRVQSVVGRYDGMSPDLLKPHPHLVVLALGALLAEPSSTVLIGDSSSDVLAAHAASISCVGYAATATKAAELMSIGADAISHDLADVAGLVRTSK
jgi:beta-phosphoglucomutase-like phosphatase (HAD superfamily)